MLILFQDTKPISVSDEFRPVFTSDSFFFFFYFLTEKTMNPNGLKRNNQSRACMLACHYFKRTWHILEQYANLNQQAV